MQSRGRCRDRSLCLCEHGLVVGSVALVGHASNVGRQRHGAALIDRLVEDGPVKGEDERDLAALGFVLAGGVELAEDTDLAPAPETHRGAPRYTPARL